MYALVDNKEKRRCPVMEGKVNVGLIFRVMLGPQEAARYMTQAKIPDHIAARVLHEPQRCRYHPALSLEMARIGSAGPVLVN
jgi:hypothetical protein